MRAYFICFIVSSILTMHPFTESTGATEPKTVGTTKTADGTKEALPERQTPVTTKGFVTVGGKKVGYTATTGTLPVQNDAGETGAEIFFVSYNADNTSRRPRPIVFAFNGGPGAAAVWLHLGALGPRRVEMLPDGNMPQPPFRLVENEHTWLDVADLVFVDPVGTGFSRAVNSEALKKYTTVQGDIDAVGRFVRLYLSRYGKWDAPIFLVGESYGSLRVAGLSEYLAEHGFALNGIIFISTVLNMQTIQFDYGNDLPYSLFLPSYAATAWYHKKLAPQFQGDLEKTVTQAENFAATEYLTALFRGDRLSLQERQAVAEKMASFTGLSADFINEHNLRIDSRTFAAELLKDTKEMVGFMDSRFRAPNLDPSHGPGFDATVATIRPPFTSMFNSYVRKELGYSSDLEYFVLGGGIGHWDWQAKNSYADTSENLRNSFAKNRHLKLFVASGLFDLATPHFAAEYTLSHMGLSAEMKKEITLRRYSAGHMMYLETSSLEKLKVDIAEFLKDSLPQ